MDVVVNVAMSLDGKLSSVARDRIRLSGPADTKRVHRVRATCDAVGVGIGTVLADDPSLTVRSTDSSGSSRPQPTRVVFDSRARTPPDASVVDGRAPSIILASERAPTSRVRELEDTGVKVISAGTDRVDLESGVAALEDRGISKLLIEGGGELIFSVIDAGLVTELTIYIDPVVIGGRDAPTVADGDGFLGAFPRYELTDIERIDDGVLLRLHPTDD